MKKSVNILCVIGMVSASYFAGSYHVLETSSLNAQEQPNKLSKEDQERLTALASAFAHSLENLKETQRYRPAIEGVNTFAISVGGVDAIEDLESGQGVDPETFAGLYADLAVAGVSEHLGKDDKGRVTYKNKVVQLYSISRLKELFAERQEQFAGSVE